ncbi:hypothetical protein NQ317_013699 [Molorchus minor]|uniref:Uncharacterized protein n=1 Tax=Molorchus minor TaxID=1323400 RepID=A0ABQ9JFT3_9CUCU|nr:hypothetical protein NQ317_013699 [Molorchus minor]
MATFLNCPTQRNTEDIVFCRSSATLLSNGGADIIQLKPHGGWCSSQVAEGYIKRFKLEKCKVNNIVWRDGTAVPV